MSKKEIGLAGIIYRFLLGFFSGLIGAIIAGIILFGSQAILGEFYPAQIALENSGDVGIQTTKAQSSIINKLNPLQIWGLMISLFLGGLAASISYILMICGFETRKQKQATILTQVFYGNMVIFVMFLPLFLFSQFLMGTVEIHTIAAAYIFSISIFAYLVLELFHEPFNFLVKLYGMILSGILMVYSTMPFYGDNAIEGETLFMGISILLFFSSIGLGSSITESIYGWIKNTYGSDPLSAQKLYGADYVESNRTEEKKKNEKNDFNEDDFFVEI